MIGSRVSYNCLLGVIGRIKRVGHPDTRKTQPLSNSAGYVREDLGLADSEHFRTAARAYALGRRFAILHGNVFGILHFFFSSTFYTIRLNHIDLPS